MGCSTRPQELWAKGERDISSECGFFVYHYPVILLYYITPNYRYTALTQTGTIILSDKSDMTISRFTPPTPTRIYPISDE